MALIDQQDKGKKENSEESFITNLINRCLLLTQLIQRYIIPTSIQYSNFIEKRHKCLVNILLGTKRLLFCWHTNVISVRNYIIKNVYEKGIKVHSCNILQFNHFNTRVKHLIT